MLLGWSSLRAAACSPNTTFRTSKGLEFVDTFSKNTQISHLIKISSVGANRPTDRHDEVNSRFSQFCKMCLKRT